MKNFVLYKPNQSYAVWMRRNRVDLAQLRESHVYQRAQWSFAEQIWLQTSCNEDQIFLRNIRSNSTCSCVILVVIAEWFRAKKHAHQAAKRTLELKENLEWPNRILAGSFWFGGVVTFWVKNKKLEVVGFTQASDEKSCRRKGCICTGTTLFDLTKKTAFGEAIL